MIVRRLNKGDLSTRVEWMNSPQVYGSMHYEIPVCLEKTMTWYENNLNNDARADLVFEENGNLLAMGGLTSIEREVNKAEMYIFVNPNSQRSGIGTEATKLLCRYGFEHLGLNKIYLETNEDNYAARRVYEKCGFLLEGVHRAEYINKDGIYLSRIYMGLLKSDFHD